MSLSKSWMALMPRRSCLDLSGFSTMVPSLWKASKARKRSSMSSVWRLRMSCIVNTWNSSNVRRMLNSGSVGSRNLWSIRCSQSRKSCEARRGKGFADWQVVMKFALVRSAMYRSCLCTRRSRRAG